MPDSIADEKVLKRSHKKNTQLVKNANQYSNQLKIDTDK
jgi:hypothetical protein